MRAAIFFTLVAVAVTCKAASVNIEGPTRPEADKEEQLHRFVDFFKNLQGSILQQVKQAIDWIQRHNNNKSQPSNEHEEHPEGAQAPKGSGTAEEAPAAAETLGPVSSSTAKPVTEQVPRSTTAEVQSSTTTKGPSSTTTVAPSSTAATVPSSTQTTEGSPTTTTSTPSPSTTTRSSSSSSAAPTSTPVAGQSPSTSPTTSTSSTTTEKPKTDEQNREEVLSNLAKLQDSASQLITRFQSILQIAIKSGNDIAKNLINKAIERAIKIRDKLNDNAKKQPSELQEILSQSESDFTGIDGFLQDSSKTAKSDLKAMIEPARAAVQAAGQQTRVIAEIIKKFGSSWSFGKVISAVTGFFGRLGRR